MRATALALCLLPLACASDPATMTLLPDWSGPPVHCRHRGDGGLDLELLAPTAGHVFSMRSVDVAEGRADVRLEHREPTADFVAQVVTPLVVHVPAERLGDARAVCVWVARDGGPERLALTTARPQR